VPVSLQRFNRHVGRTGRERNALADNPHRDNSVRALLFEMCQTVPCGKELRSVMMPSRVRFFEAGWNDGIAFRAKCYNSRLTKRLSRNSAGAVTSTGSVSREIDRCRQTA
jgi:hypothetical protein